MIQRKLFICLILSLLSVSSLFSQADLSGYKIFVNPGHGGYDSNDRHIIATDFWESEGNLVKGLYLRQLLMNLNATVYMSRTTNTTDDDLALSVIDEMANSANVDFFLSIHSNGYAGTSNQPLTLFRGYDNAPVFAGAKTMATIIWQKLYEKGNCWTNSSQYVKGDWTFYPDWGDQVGLGVLRTLNMPGVLSEGSFHDYISESWRMRNEDFLHHESWALLRSFLQYYNINPSQYGVIAGVVRDTLLTPSWYFKPGTRDQKMPLNGVKVTLTPGDKIYNVDNLNNGFFFYDSVTPGTYKIYFDGLADYYRDSLIVEVTANTSTLADFYMQYDTLKVPQLVSFGPEQTDSTLFNQAFTFSFSLPMNPDSVKKALQLVPSVDMTYTWDGEYKVLVVKPLAGYASKTNYTFTLGTRACSKWKVSLDQEKVYSFVTFSRQNLKVEKTYPTDGRSAVSLYPQMRVCFDAPLNETIASAEINVLNSSGEALAKKNEGFISSGGKGVYFFELEQPLSLDAQYRLFLGAGVSDGTGLTLGEDTEYSFTTHISPYPTGTVVESYEDITKFWDPESSGSTTGTSGSLTTFTASSEVKHAGSYSGRLNYVFTGTSGVCRVFDTSKPSIGSDAASSFGIWVFGDLSNNLLEYWFYSNGSTNQIVKVDTIDWAGWEFKSIPFTSIGASGDILFHSTVIRQTGIGETSGTLYFDNGTTFIPTGIEDQYADDIDLIISPNPLVNNGKIRFNLSLDSFVTISLYGLDGRKVAEIFNAELETGVNEIPWVPASYLPDGIYIIRLDIKPERGGRVTTKAARWVLAR